MSERLDSAQVTADLNSGDPHRVGAALQALDEAWRQRNFTPLPMPPPEILDAFGDDVPRQMVELYLSVIQYYVDFEPTPTGPEQRQAMVEAVIRHGRGELTNVVAMALMIDPYPAFAAEDALRYLENLELEKPLEKLAALHFVDSLLGSDKTRGAVVDAMRRWTIYEQFGDIIAAARPRLDPDELARLKATTDQV
jgi:hypothetical protein